MKTNRNHIIQALENATHLDLSQKILVNDLEVIFSLQMEMRDLEHDFTIDEVCDLIQLARTCERKLNFRRLMDYGGNQKITLRMDIEDEPFKQTILTNNLYDIILVEMMSNGHQRLKPMDLSISYNGRQKINDEVIEFIEEPI